MKRTTVMLPDDLAYLLDQERRSRDVSAATVIREAVAQYLVSKPQKKTLRIAALGASGSTDTAQRIDEILAEEWGSDAGASRIIYGDSETLVRGASPHTDQSQPNHGGAKSDETARPIE